MAKLGDMQLVIYEPGLINGKRVNIHKKRLENGQISAINGWKTGKLEYNGLEVIDNVIS